MQTTSAANPWTWWRPIWWDPCHEQQKDSRCWAVMQDKFTTGSNSSRYGKPPLQPSLGPSGRGWCFASGDPGTSSRDKGQQFISKEFTKMLQGYGIEHRKIPPPPVHPQCNPVERVNRVIKTMIAQLIDGSHRDWDKWLPEISFAYNSPRHDSTRYSPAYLNYEGSRLPPGTPPVNHGGGGRQGPIRRAVRDFESSSRGHTSRPPHASPSHGDPKEGLQFETTELETPHRKRCHAAGTPSVLRGEKLCR